MTKHMHNVVLNIIQQAIAQAKFYRFLVMKL
jgi:hypothetical protein